MWCCVFIFTHIDPVQRGNEISYFEPGLEPFTLNGDYIVDSLPSLIYTDFKRLSPYYDFPKAWNGPMWW